MIQKRRGAEMGLLRGPAPCSQQQLRKVLFYDAETGSFTWLVNRGRRCCAGQPAGGINKGRHRIKVFDKLCEASNLAWLYENGVWPTGDIDHIDNNPANNRIDNLRDATRAQNCHNQKRRLTNTAGYKGVSRHGARWRARIAAPGIRYDLGVYDCPEHAAAAYRIAAPAIHGEFARAA